MFENILHQERVTEVLGRDVQSGQLPRGMLFYGPEHAGKLSAALELARVISCKRPGAPWGCTCPVCTQHRFLMSPYVLFLGKRAFDREIRGAGAALTVEDKEATRFLFLRSVRKLVRRFDPVLWDQDQKLAQASKAIEKLEDLLEPLLPGKPALTSEALASTLGQVYKLSDTVRELLPQDGITIGMVRKVNYWVHTADAAHPKVIIIESAETMNEASRNSLLKTLEEPPPSVYFILMTTRRPAIIQTVLSRVRTYEFAVRGILEKDVLERIFKQPRDTWTSLDAFFRGMAPSGETAIAETAELLVRGLLGKAGLTCLVDSGREPGLAEIHEAIGKDRGDLEDIIRLAVDSLLRTTKELDNQAIANRLVDAGLDTLRVLDALQGIARHLSRAWSEAVTFNLSSSSLIERVYSEAGDGPCVDSYNRQ